MKTERLEINSAEYNESINKDNPSVENNTNIGENKPLNILIPS